MTTLFVKRKTIKYLSTMTKFTLEFFMEFMAAVIFGGAIMLGLIIKLGSKNKAKCQFPTIKIAPAVTNAIIPDTPEVGNAGIDLKALSDGSIEAGKRDCVDTGIIVEIPSGCFGRIFPRSGLSVKNNIDIGAGVIDSSYRGNIKVVLINNGTESFDYKRGDRIAQMVILPYYEASIEPVASSDELSSTQRGEGGFGSTGR